MTVPEPDPAAAPTTRGLEGERAGAGFTQPALETLLRAHAQHRHGYTIPHTAHAAHPRARTLTHPKWHVHDTNLSLVSVITQELLLSVYLSSLGL